MNIRKEKQLFFFLFSENSSSKNHLLENIKAHRVQHVPQGYYVSLRLLRTDNTYTIIFYKCTYKYFIQAILYYERLLYAPRVYYNELVLLFYLTTTKRTGHYSYVINNNRECSCVHKHLSAQYILAVLQLEVAKQWGTFEERVREFGDVKVNLCRSH